MSEGLPRVAVLKGKIVVDAMNYWPPVNGRLDEFEVAHTGSTEIVQRALPASVVVKTLGHLTYHELEGDRWPARCLWLKDVAKNVCGGDPTPAYHGVCGSLHGWEWPSVVVGRDSPLNSPPTSVLDHAGSRTGIAYQLAETR